MQSAGVTISFRPAHGRKDVHREQAYVPTIRGKWYGSAALWDVMRHIAVENSLSATDAISIR
jgi:hypothetical protein